MTEKFADLLYNSIATKNTRVVLGVDPHLSMIPDEVFRKDPSSRSREELASGILKYCSEIVQACANSIAAVKLQVAFFEQLGPFGWQALETLCRECRDLGLPVISDAKRGDIGSTAAAYAAYHLGGSDNSSIQEGLRADAMTCSPYLGIDTLEAFSEHLDTGKGIFVLSKTSNAGSGVFQDVEIAEKNTPLYHLVAHQVERFGKTWVGDCGYSSVGIVVGATHKSQASSLRRNFPNLIFLVPGYGAQGATAEDVSVCFDGDGFGAIVNASRSIMFASQRGGHRTTEWGKAALEAATLMRDAINQAIKKG